MLMANGSLVCYESIFEYILEYNSKYIEYGPELTVCKTIG